MAIVVSEVNTRVRFLMGGLPTTTLSDVILDAIIQTAIDEIGSTDDKLCEVTYKSLLDAIKYLQRVAEMTAGSQAGDIKSRREKLGKREIQVDYATADGGAGDTGWDAMYDHYINHPEDVCLTLAATTSVATVIIGGVSETEYDRVNENIDSRNAYQLNVSKKYNRSTSQNVRRRKSAFLN